MLYDEGHMRLWESNTGDKTRCGEGGRGQMISPVAKEDTAATRQGWRWSRCADCDQAEFPPSSSPGQSSAVIAQLILSN